MSHSHTSSVSKVFLTIGLIRRCYKILRGTLECNSKALLSFSVVLSIKQQKQQLLHVSQQDVAKSDFDRPDYGQL